MRRLTSSRPNPLFVYAATHADKTTTPQSVRLNFPHGSLVLNKSTESVTFTRSSHSTTGVPITTAEAMHMIQNMTLAA